MSLMGTLAKLVNKIFVDGAGWACYDYKVCRTERSKRCPGFREATISGEF